MAKSKKKKTRTVHVKAYTQSGYRVALHKVRAHTRRIK